MDDRFGYIRRSKDIINLNNECNVILKPSTLLCKVVYLAYLFCLFLKKLLANKCYIYLISKEKYDKNLHVII